MELAEGWLSLELSVAGPHELTESEARCLMAGMWLLSVLQNEDFEERSLPATAAATSEIIASLRAKLGHALGASVTGADGRPSVCHGVVITTGDACGARRAVSGPGGLSTCGSHKRQDLVSTVLATLLSYPHYPRNAPSVSVEPDGQEGTGVVCSLCVRETNGVRLLEVCSELGGETPDGSTEASGFSIMPNWVGNDARLDSPGSAACQACVGMFPLAVSLLGWLHRLSSGPPHGSPPMVGAIWAWPLPLQSVTPALVASIRATLSAMSLPMGSEWNRTEPAGGRLASLLKGKRTAIKQNTNSAMRDRLRSEVAVGGDGGVRHLSFEETASGLPPRPAGAPAAAPAAGGGRSSMPPVGDGGGGVSISNLSSSILGQVSQDAESRRVQELTDLLAQMVNRISALESGGATGTSLSAALRPQRPRSLTSPADADRDGFEATHGGHRESMMRTASEDMLGMMLKPKHYGRRRLRLVGMERIDVTVGFLFMPEQRGHEAASIQIGDAIIEGTASKLGVPTRSMFGQYAQARMLDLMGDLRDKSAPHCGNGSPGAVWAEFETRLICARYQFLHAVETHLADQMVPNCEWGVAWRYMCLLYSNMWASKEVDEMSFNRDLVLYAMRTPIELLQTRQAPQELQTLVATSINPHWLTLARDIFGGGVGGAATTGAAVAAPAAAAPAGAPAKKPADNRCGVCGFDASICGSYKTPSYKCTGDLTRPCMLNQCGNYHLARGPRRWTCHQAAAAQGVLTAGELKAAFRTGYAGFVGGSHAKAGAVKTAAE